jgi:hypothetical protein
MIEYTVKVCFSGKFWYLNGELHREDGPAAEYSDGKKYWYLNGIQLTEETFLKKTKKTQTFAGKIIEVDGVQYKLMEI